MSRNTRIALDFALVSLRKIQPAIANLWFHTKSKIADTRLKFVVCNPLIRIIENKSESLVKTLDEKLSSIRDKQLPKEIEYLEKEIEKVKRKMRKEDTSCKSGKIHIAHTWEYAKVEMIPPCSSAFFQGPVIKSFEQTMSGLASRTISGLEQKIRSMDAEEARKVKEKEDALKAAQEILKKKADEKVRAQKEQQAKQAAEDLKKEKEKSESKQEKKDSKPSSEAKKKK